MRGQILLILISITAHQLFANRLDQLFLHKGNKIDRLVGYCSEKPLLKGPFFTNIESAQQCTVIIENIDIAKRASDTIETITKKRKRDKYRIAYTLSMELRGRDLYITFTYNPARIELVCTVNKSIKGVHTWIISIYDKRYRTYSTTILNKPGVKIFIDCGHGGSDSGALGVDGSREKDITLAVGQKLAMLLEDQGFMPFIQRNSNLDRYIPLDERTTYANLIAYADIVVSLHANSSPSNESARGLETYCLDATFLSPTLSDSSCLHIEKRKIDESSKLAEAVHAALMHRSGKQQIPHDRGIKQALTQILLGSEAPSILLELGFMTNVQECKALQDPAYQHFLAQRIVEGIKTYLSPMSSIT